MELIKYIGFYGLFIFVPIISCCLMIYCIIKKIQLFLIGIINIIIGIILVILSMISYLPMIFYKGSTSEIIGLIFWTIPGILLIVTGIFIKRKKIIEK